MNRGLVLRAKEIANVVNNEQTAFLRLAKQPNFRNGETGVPFICDDLQTFTFKIDGYNNIYDYDVKAPYGIGDDLYLKEPWYLLNVNDVTGTVKMCFVDESDSKTVKMCCSEREKLPFSPSAKQPALTMPKAFARWGVKIKNVKLVKLNEITSEMMTKLYSDDLSEIIREYGPHFYVFFYEFEKFRI